MRQIEYFYSAHSAYAYIGSNRLAEICAAQNCTLIHRPIALSPVVEAVGSPPFARRTRPHIDYFFGREIERWAEWRGMPILSHRPTHHDNSLDMSNGMLIAASEQGADVDALAVAILTIHWRDDADLANPDHLRKAADMANVAADRLLEVALSPEIQHQHAANTAEAIARNVFGSPTYILAGDQNVGAAEEMFYGQDRLEMLERALTVPFKAPAFHNP